MTYRFDLWYASPTFLQGIPMGLLRLYLALAVLQWHSIPDTSRYFPYSFVAVMCFFIVSGFYIAMVVDEKYRDNTLRFYLNRAVRLYPAYVIVLAAVVVAHHLGVNGIRNIGSAWQVLGQLTIFPRVLWDTVTLTPGQKADALYQFAIGPIYTVGLEILFYAVAPFFVRRHLLVLFVIFGLSIAAHAAPYWLGLPPREWQYEFFPGIFMFFVAGVLSYRLYHFIQHLPGAEGVGYCAIPAIVVYVWNLEQLAPPPYVNDKSLYGLYALVALLMPFLFLVTKRSKIDRFLGSLSYPLYVVHAPLIGIVFAYGWEPSNWIARAVSIVGAVVLAVMIERPLESVRDAIREGHARVLKTPRGCVLVAEEAQS